MYVCVCVRFIAQWVTVLVMLRAIKVLLGSRIALRILPLLLLPGLAAAAAAYPLPLFLVRMPLSIISSLPSDLLTSNSTPQILQGLPPLLMINILTPHKTSVMGGCRAND